jgi:cobalt-zinc-cadmium efflux system outer membrane protein
VRQAETDLLGASLIPNPTLLPDSQLNPFTRFSPTRQGGPPEIDVMLALPIDWLVYGKRLAAMEAARLGVDAVTADFADQVRLQVLAAVVAFFDAAEARELLRLARENLDEVTTLQEQTRKDAAAGKAEAHEVERLGLAVLDARREVRDRAEVSLRAGAALRPLLGREGNGPVPEVAGGLDAVQVGPAVDVEAVVALAEARRPDLVAARIQCDQAAAAVRSEQTRGWPALTVAPGFTYQRQQSVIGFPAARSWDVYVNAGLPLFDRNQGGVAKAESVRRQRLWSLAADRLDLRAEVE